MIVNKKLIDFTRERLPLRNCDFKYPTEEEVAV